MSAPKYGIIIIPNKRKQGEADNAPPFVLPKGDCVREFHEEDVHRDEKGQFAEVAGNGDDPDLEEIAKGIFLHLDKGLTSSEENDIISARKEDFKKKFEAGKISKRISPQKQARHQRGG